MHSRALLSGILALSLNVSLCTGGILSTFTIFAPNSTSYHVVDPLSQSIPMSFAALEFMSCTTTTDDTAGVSAPEVPQGCKDRQTCLSQSHQTVTDRSLDVFSLHDAIPLPPQTEKIVIAYEVDLYATARAGPLFEESIGYAHALQKRE